jgi:hypothetical protein
MPTVEVDPSTQLDELKVPVALETKPTVPVGVDKVPGDESDTVTMQLARVLFATGFGEQAIVVEVVRAATATFVTEELVE